MQFSKSIIEIIKERTSRRTYDARSLDNNHKKYIENLLKLDELKSPFTKKSGKCRFKLIETPEFDPKENRKLGTYGLIKGAQSFIVGAIELSQYGKEHHISISRFHLGKLHRTQ